MTVRFLARIGAALILCSCAGNPQSLPVEVSRCNAFARAPTFRILATVANKSDRPISRLDLTTAFYQDFRYQRYTASARLEHELDPGQEREITFEVAGPAAAAPRGQAIRCIMTHIGYLDGTSADAPPGQ